MFELQGLLIYHHNPVDRGDTGRDSVPNIVGCYAKRTVSFGIAMGLRLMFWYYTSCLHVNESCSYISDQGF